MKQQEDQGLEFWQKVVLYFVVLTGLIASAGYLAFSRPDCEACQPSTMPPNCIFGQAPYVAVSYYTSSFKDMPQACYPSVDFPALFKLVPFLTTGSFMRAIIVPPPTYGANTPDFILAFWVYSCCMSFCLDIFVLRLYVAVFHLARKDWKIFLSVKLAAAVFWLFILFRHGMDTMFFWHILQLCSTFWAIHLAPILFFGDAFLTFGLFFFTYVDFTSFAVLLGIIGTCCVFHHLGRFLPWSTCEPHLEGHLGTV